MVTISLNKDKDRTKKLIELPNDVCRRLAVRATAMGTSVKKLIENLVISSVEESDDEAIYAYMLETRPDGNEMMSLSEQNSLLDQLRKKVKSDEV